MNENEERRQLLIDVARMYYFENMSQQQIADILHMSRSNVSLLLKSCLENSIIEIKINDTVSRAHDLAALIKQKFSLKTVLIAQSFKNPERCLESVCRLAAHYLKSILSNGMLLGYTNDIVAYHIADKLSFLYYVKINTIQMMGGLSNIIKDIDGQALAQIFSKKLNGTSYVLQAPLKVKSSTLKELLMAEPVIQSTFEMYSKIDVAIMQITKPNLLPHIQQSDEICSKAELLQLSELGAVCHFCGRYLDKNGSSCNAGINERIMAIDPETIKSIPTVIGVSANISNTQAVLSCVKGGYINSLIIDEAMARSLL